MTAPKRLEAKEGAELEAASNAEPAWDLTHLARPWTVNAERKAGHWSTRAALVKEWREAFWLLAREQKVPPLGRITVEVRIECRTGRSLPDPGAAAGAVKAAVDGLVDAKVIPDDRSAQVAWVRMWAPTVTGRDAVTLTVAAVYSPSQIE